MPMRLGLAMHELVEVLDSIERKYSSRPSAVPLNRSMSPLPTSRQDRESVRMLHSEPAARLQREGPTTRATPRERRARSHGVRAHSPQSSVIQQHDADPANAVWIPLTFATQSSTGNGAPSLMNLNSARKCRHAYTSLWSTNLARESTPELVVRVDVLDEWKQRAPILSGSAAHSSTVNRSSLHIRTRGEYLIDIGSDSPHDLVEIIEIATSNHPKSSFTILNKPTAHSISTQLRVQEKTITRYLVHVSSSIQAFLRVTFGCRRNLHKAQTLRVIWFRIFKHNAEHESSDNKPHHEPHRNSRTNSPKALFSETASSAGEQANSITMNTDCEPDRHGQQQLDYTLCSNRDQSNTKSAGNESTHSDPNVLRYHTGAECRVQASSAFCVDSSTSQCGSSEPPKCLGDEQIQLFSVEPGRPYTDEVHRDEMSSHIDPKPDDASAISMPKEFSMSGGSSRDRKYPNVQPVEGPFGLITSTPLLSPQYNEDLKSSPVASSNAKDESTPNHLHFMMKRIPNPEELDPQPQAQDHRDEYSFHKLQSPPAPVNIQKSLIQSDYSNFSATFFDLDTIHFTQASEIDLSDSPSMWNIARPLPPHSGARHETRPTSSSPPKNHANSASADVVRSDRNSQESPCRSTQQDGTVMLPPRSAHKYVTTHPPVQNAVTPNAYRLLRDLRSGTTSTIPSRVETPHGFASRVPSLVGEESDEWGSTWDRTSGLDTDSIQEFQSKAAGLHHPMDEGSLHTIRKCSIGFQASTLWDCLSALLETLCGSVMWCPSCEVDDIAAFMRMAHSFIVVHLNVPSEDIMDTLCRSSCSPYELDLLARGIKENGEGTVHNYMFYATRLKKVLVVYSSYSTSCEAFLTEWCNEREARHRSIRIDCVLEVIPRQQEIRNNNFEVANLSERSKKVLAFEEIFPRIMSLVDDFGDDHLLYICANVTAHHPLLVAYEEGNKYIPQFSANRFTSYNASRVAHSNSLLGAATMKCITPAEVELSVGQCSFRYCVDRHFTLRAYVCQREPTRVLTWGRHRTPGKVNSNSSNVEDSKPAVSLRVTLIKDDVRLDHSRINGAVLGPPESGIYHVLSSAQRCLWATVATCDTVIPKIDDEIMDAIYVWDYPSPKHILYFYQDEASVQSVQDQFMKIRTLDDALCQTP